MKISQCAALAYRFEGDKPKVLMITSRKSGRWVLPKGHIEEGQTPREAVLVEAFEEAGLKGHVAETKIGSYSYQKSDRPDVAGFKVAVYPMEVSDIADDWPEKAQRQRVWMDFDTAANSVAEPALKTLLSDFGTMLNEISALRPTAR